MHRTNHLFRTSSYGGPLRQSLRAGRVALLCGLSLSVCSLPAASAQEATPAESIRPAPDPEPTIPIKYDYVLVEQGVMVTAQQGKDLRIHTVLPIDGVKTHLLAYEKHLYVACGSRGIAVIDVQEPAKPVLRSIIAKGEPIRQIANAGKTLVATLMDGTSLIFDRSNPDQPQQLRRVERLTSTDAEVPKQPSSPGRPGVGLLIAGASTFGGAYLIPIAGSLGYKPVVAVPVAGPILLNHDPGSSLMYLGLISTLAQTAGLGMMIAGAVQMVTGPPARSTATSSLFITPYSGRDGVGLMAVGRF